MKPCCARWCFPPTKPTSTAQIVRRDTNITSKSTRGRLTQRRSGHIPAAARRLRGRTISAIRSLLRDVHPSTAHCCMSQFSRNCVTSWTNIAITGVASIPSGPRYSSVKLLWHPLPSPTPRVRAFPSKRLRRLVSDVTLNAFQFADCLFSFHA